MKCANKFCIYQENGKCLLEKISLDCSGICEECICLNIDDNFLQKCKSDLLRSIET